MRNQAGTLWTAIVISFVVVAACLRPIAAQTPSKAEALRAVERGDYVAAARLLRPFAERGDADAQLSLGRILMTGRNGLTRDDREALAWFRKAAAQGSARGQNNVAMMYERGAGVPQSEADAAHWYRLAAMQGLAAAEYNLARLYEMGRGVPLDFAQASHWYAKAAGQGYARAQTSLGLLYLDGLGVAQSDADALRWFRAAAEAGLAEGEYYVGVMHGAGAGVPQDDAEAVRWYRKAAAQGLAEADAKLALDSTRRRESDREDVRNGPAKRAAAQTAAEQQISDARAAARASCSRKGGQFYEGSTPDLGFCSK